MTLTFTATYEGGVLRPDEPLPLADGATVQLALENTGSAGPDPGTPFSRSYGLLGWTGDVKALDEYLDNPDDSQWEDDEIL